MKRNKALTPYINRLVRLAKKAYPDLKYTVLIPGYSDTDANIIVDCPVKFEEKIRKAVTDTELKFLLDKDIFITTLVVPSNNRHQKSA